MKTATKKYAKEDGAGRQGNRSDDGGGWRRDQVGKVDNHHQRGWQRGRDEKEEDKVTELESDYISRLISIFVSDSGGFSYDYPSKSSP